MSTAKYAIVHSSNEEYPTSVYVYYFSDDSVAYTVMEILVQFLDAESDQLVFVELSDGELIKLVPPEVVYDMSNFVEYLLANSTGFNILDYLDETFQVDDLEILNKLADMYSELIIDIEPLEQE